MNYRPNVLARLSLQRALLSCISKDMRAVTFKLEEHCMKINFYIHGEISENDRELASCVETEVLADYDASFSVVAECLRQDFPLTIEDDGVWVFHRQESFD